MQTGVKSSSFSGQSQNDKKAKGTRTTERKKPNKQPSKKPKRSKLCLITLIPGEGVTSTMNVISYQRIREFFSRHGDAQGSLKAWYTTTKKSNWQNLAELRKVYPSADLVGRYTVFNISGNKYRLIARIIYRSQTVFIIAVLTHEEYDLGRWKE